VHPAENNSSRHVTRQIGSAQLPSGKTVPILQSSRAASTQDLTVCEACACALMQPLDEQPLEQDGLFQSIRRCPNCETVASAIASYADMEQYDDSMDAGSYTLVETIETVSRLPVYTGYRP
jgi:hypothetical protein